MKKRLSKLLAVLLAASLCVPTLGTTDIKAATTDADGVFWTDAETVANNTISSTERFVNFNEGWKFNLGDSSTAYEKEFNDSSWDNVTLPHDYSIFQNFTANGEAESGFLPGGIGWYRKSFNVPASLADKTIVLNFDGVYKDATVYVNGEKIGEHHYGYTPFAFDLTGKLICDGKSENLIAVKVENQIPSSRWYSGSGIYRDVTLEISNPVHVAHNGAYFTTPKLKESSGSDGTVNAAIDVQNDGKSAASVTVKNTIYEKGSETALNAVETAAEIPAGETKTVSGTLSVSNPKLWSPETPNLYMVKTEILQGTTVLDTCETEIGFKWYEFVNNVGFKLNGKNVKINGVCMHHDQGALGSAAYYDAMYRQLTIMKDMGVNTIRITHNPGAESFVDICNEIGLMVIEEAFDGWEWPKNGNSNDFSTHFNVNMTADNQVIGGDASMTWAEFVFKSIIKRDRNDASIILWSLGNEISEGTADNASWPWGDHADNLIRWAKEVDEAHPLTSGSNRRSLTNAVAPVNEKIYESGGVAGYNYGSIGEMNSLHQTYPVFLWSETVSSINSRGVYTDNSTGTSAVGGHLTSYDESCVGWGKTVHDSIWLTYSNDYLAGECMWTGFDYIGEPTPWNGTGTGIHAQAPNKSIAAPNSSYFGIVDTSGFPKDSYYLYRSQWNKSANTLHLVTAWDPDNMKESDGKTPVWVYSNAPKVELWRKVGNSEQKVGTATRKAVTTDAGHVHYEYTTESNDDALCVTSSGSEGTSLYSVFYVAFEAGTIYAKAFDEAGTDITASCEGNSSVSTPGASSKLRVTQDKETITADGSSLVYIAVDVTDANGNLKTTAKNTINFTLEGQGEIVGVDNGDQATIKKFQQRSVLKSSTSAQIEAYAGKALVIVRSTKRTGSFTVKAEAEGLTGASVSVSTVSDTAGAPEIISYKLSRHCYVPTGSASVTFPTSITASLTDGSEKEIPIQFSGYNASDLATRGNYNIDGSFNYEGNTYAFSLTLHVYDPIGGVEGFSYYTRPNVLPSLPATAMVYYTDETPFEEYPISWDEDDISAADLSEAGKIATINGIVDVLGKQYPTQATIRVAEGINPKTTNFALSKDHLVENERYGDKLESLTNGTRASTVNTERWTTWSHSLPTESRDDIMIAMDWATAILTDQINLFFYKENIATSVFPTDVKFEYASASNYDDAANWLVANEWTEIKYATPTSVDGFTDTTTTFGKTYKLEKTINPQALRITFTQPANSFIGLNEIEVIGTDYTYLPKTSAALTSAKFKDTVIAASLEEGQNYSTTAGLPNRIEFENPNNAALTFIYTDETHTTAKVIARSEDGNDEKSYTFTFTDVPTDESKDKLKDKLTEYEEQTSQIANVLQTINNYSNLQSMLTQFNKEVNTMTESELTENLTAIQSSYKQVFKEAIRAKITEYKALDATKYSAGYSELQTLISNIEGEQLDTLSESELAARLVSLTEAYGNLKLATTPPDNPIPPSEPVSKATVGDVEYQILTDTTAAAIGTTNTKAKSITIEASVTIGDKSYDVTEIAENAFKSAKGTLKTVTIGKNVTSIGKNAFNGCKKITKITFKGTALKPCKKNAFKGTKKKVKVIAPKSIKTAKRKTFVKNLTKTGGMKSPKVQYKK